jgi:Ferritin-like
VARTASLSIPQNRPMSELATDISALRALAQAAINVELFTIPLYMATMYSIHGTHQITGKNDFYAGRLWPGSAPAVPSGPQSNNQEAFNLIFSVFIEEMLHLQMAANIASAIGLTPSFTSPALQGPNHEWTCYGPECVVIPHIVDLSDTENFADVKVDIAALSRNQLRLFLAIEAPEDRAQGELAGVRRTDPDRYHPIVPFDGWTPTKNEKDLPMFGTIGWMYQCYFDYMNIVYDDGTTLWDNVWQPDLLFPVQNDLFNFISKGHPESEYAHFDAALNADTLLAEAEAYSQTVSERAFLKVQDMMNAITDQGEGSILKERAPGAALAVQERYQADKGALEADYPEYNDRGEKAPSSRAVARFDNGAMDHFERFTFLLLELFDAVTTWPDWFEAGNHWTAEALETEDGPVTLPADDRLPTTQSIAEALNYMAIAALPGGSTGPGRAEYFVMMSQAAVGALAGVTTVLDTYWSMPGKEFPYPSMVGSGDRMSICWAVFGEAPDLATPIEPILKDVLYHACQGLDFEHPGNNCASVAVFHSCRASNACKAQGGCGFVQSVNGGAGCGGKTMAAKLASGGDDSGSGVGAAAPLFSPPSDNKCRTFGGCAIPISASQLFPLREDSDGNEFKAGTMQLYDFTGPDHHSVEFATMPFAMGEKVDAVAYNAYLKVMAHRSWPALDPVAAPPNILRLVFPPST